MLPGAPALKRARKAASQRGLEASLAFNDWMQTCADMNSCCAYCGKAISCDGSIDHFLPMAGQGGTSITNCVLSCRVCNQRKGESRPETFLSHDPERLARLVYYLAHRRSGQGHSNFWSFPLPQEERHLMNTEEMQATPLNIEEMQATSHKLSSGTELHIYNSEHNMVLRFRQTPALETNPLSSSIQVATSLTPSECIALAQTLLLYSSSKIEDKQPVRNPAPLW